VYQAVEDGVSGRGIADQLVPGVDRVLAGDQGGPGALAVVEDLEEESVLVGFQGSQSPVVMRSRSTRASFFSSRVRLPSASARLS